MAALDQIQELLAKYGKVDCGLEVVKIELEEAILGELSPRI